VLSLRSFKPGIAEPAGPLPKREIEFGFILEVESSAEIVVAMPAREDSARQNKGASRSRERNAKRTNFLISLFYGFFRCALNGADQYKLAYLSVDDLGLRVAQLPLTCPPNAINVS
jgi:hypothetical protein